MNPVEQAAMRRSRSGGLVGAARKMVANRAGRALRINAPASSGGRSGTITPSNPARTASWQKPDNPYRYKGFAYAMATNGTSVLRRSIRTVSKTARMVTPRRRASADAHWIVGPAARGAADGGA